MISKTLLNFNEEILKNLNPQQKEAVLVKDGPILIIAGAGSGKTRVIAHKIAHLIKSGINPKNILAITFTNKAAGEMSMRIFNLLLKINNISAQLLKNSLPTIGTFHAVCLSILRKEIENLNYKKNFVIYDSDDQISLIKEIIKEQNIDSKQFQPPVIKEKISLAKNELIDFESYKNSAANFFEEKVALVYEAYQKKLKKLNALDFDDLILFTVKIFQKHPHILENYQNKFKYILVDEYQDTNFAQYILISLLAQKYQNICVVGDIDQAIYSWRGADFRNILNFEKDYPNSKIIMLEENYRSTKNILEAADYIISKNLLRKDKKLITQKSVGEKINVVVTKNEKEEAEFIAKEILILKNGRKLKFNDFCVLYRINAQSRAIEEALLKYNLPYKIIGGIRFYERKEIKDILAYLKYIQNENDIFSLKRIINIPPRNLNFIKNLKDDELKKLMEAPDNFKSKLSQKNALLNFINLILDLKNLQKSISLTEFIKLLIQKIDYEYYLKENFENAEEKIENIKELLSIANLYKNLKPHDALEKFLENAALIQDQDEISEKENAVHLMTIHAAKGLEFPIIFIAGLEESIFPHSKSYLSPEQEEEERRLCYVAITRAKNNLYLISAENRKIFGSTLANPPSRFLLDIPEHLIEFMDLTKENFDQNSKDDFLNNWPDDENKENEINYYNF